MLTRYAPLRRSPSIKPESLIMLPLDLHVLSLPLAFILSQDQTLHCIIFYITLSLSLTLYFLIPINKRINASRFFLVFLGTCFLYSIKSSLFNELVVSLCEGPFFERGCKGTLYFLISKFFLKNFSFFVFQRQSFQELLTLAGHPFFKWECKGTTFFITSKLF